jgi:hypothetical protein
MTAIETFERDVVQRVNGRRFFGIDGADLMLPQSDEIREKFKAVSGSHLPHARASIFYDVIGGYIFNACFDSVETDERTMATTHLERVKHFLCKDDVVLLDRGYPSKKLLAYFEENDISFVMRLQKSFSPAIDTNNEKDFIHSFKYEGKDYRVRIVRMPKVGGADTLIVTNLFGQEFTPSIIYDFYAKRWAVETGYLELKVRLEAEKFSGKTVESLEQDFFARLFLMNIEAAIKAETNGIISNNDDQNPHKYPRKTNENILFGRLRKNIWKCLLSDEDSKRDAIIDKLILDASKTTIDIRKKRHKAYPRAFRSHKRITESPKRCL